MITTIADILKAFSQHELATLDSEDLAHCPTIGKMYEGLTKEIVERSLPAWLDLKVVSGFAYFEEILSGQIDCMLVRGEGHKIPYTDDYKWHIKDVIAIFEVKKRLNPSDLSDSYDHLRDISNLHSTYIQSNASKGEGINLSWPLRMFSCISGVAIPNHSSSSTLPLDLEMIYHTLVMEYVSPVRIVMGHHGWKKEKTLRWPAPHDRSTCYVSS